MKRSRTWLFLCAAILVAGVVGCFWVMRPSTGKTVEILQDGNVLYIFDLSRTEDQVIEVFYQNRSNTVQIQDGKICVQAAECPDQTCVHMGYLSDSGLPIVCLPNRLVIQFSNAELDGIAN